MATRDHRPSATRTVSLGVLAALPLSACVQDEGDGSLRVSKVEYDNETALTLTFTQPIVDPADVDPTAFRISLAQSRSFTDEGMVYEGTYYVDPSYVFGDYSAGPLTVTSLSAGASANELVLEISESLAYACTSIDSYLMYAEYYSEAYPGSKFDIALLVHYAGGDIPIATADGKELADIFPDWVVTTEGYVDRDGFGIRNALRIPCP